MVSNPGWGPRSVGLRIVLCAWALAAVAAVGLTAQDSGRLWGAVHTTTGERYEGFIRWDRNETNWVDVLDGSKDRSEEAYESWIQAVRGGQRPTRTVDLEGYRISWNEDDPDFPYVSTSGIRFGHLRDVTVIGRDRARLTLKSGEMLELSRGGSDIGTSMRDLVVEEPDGTVHELEWENLDRVEFGAAPNGVRAGAQRLYGSVEDRRGRVFSGYLSWDLDEVLTSDVLDGEDPDRRDREIPFRDIRAIERGAGHALVTLTSGETLDLSGSNDVGRGHRGVQISDPDLGMVEVEWDDLERVTFQNAPEAPTYLDFDGGGRLFGTVTTEDDEEIRGWIRWDADEEWSWELVNGISEDVGFAIELGQIERIAKSDFRGAVVTLFDGRIVELDDSNDVTEDNKGIFLQELPKPESPAPDSVAIADSGRDSVTSADPERDSVTAADSAWSRMPTGPSEAPWRYVSWRDFKEIRFERPRRPTSSTAGRQP